MDPWIEGEYSEDWVDVIDYDGDDLGFLLAREASKLDLTLQVIETPERYLTDPYVQYHAQLAHERGVLGGGKDLNDVQVVLLASRIIKRRDAEQVERERIFEERFFAANPEGYQAYKKEQDRRTEVDGEVASVEQRVPRSIEEFLATLDSFSEEGPPGSDKEKDDKAEGWLSSFLDDSELGEMED